MNRPGIRDPERADEIKRRYLGGEAVRAIAAATGFSRQYVNRLLRAADMPVRRQHQAAAVAPDSENAHRAIELYLCGVRPKEIRQRYPGIELGPILKAHGIDARTARDWLTHPEIDHRTALVVDLYREGLKLKEIKARLPFLASLKSGERRVFNYLERAGVKPGRIRKSKEKR